MISADGGINYKSGNTNRNDKMYDKMFSGDFYANVTKTIKTSSTTKKLEVYVTGPFCNKNTGKTNWILVFGDIRRVFFLKSEFTRGYIENCLESVKGRNIDVIHYKTFYNINNSMKEFGIDSVWRRTQRGKTVTTMSFAISCETANETNIVQTVNETVDFISKTMEKRKRNPIRPMIIHYLNDHQNGLFTYILNK
jgi:hypothetical protein